jgi:endonuclease-3
MPRETLAARQKRAGRINDILRSCYPEAHTALHHENPLQLLVSTILSAQCTDERVNQVTRTLFATYKTATDFATADPRQLEEDIRPTGFFRNKARNIQGCCRGLLMSHGGKVPRSLEELVRLPGVGRKTANVVLGSAFGIATGVVVDTHVARLSRRLNLSAQKTPEKIEADLMKLLPQKEWIDFSHRLIFHGRQVCAARKPRCAECRVGTLCPSYAP